MSKPLNQGERVFIEGPYIPSSIECDFFESPTQHRTHDKAWIGDGTYETTLGSPMYGNIIVKIWYDPDEDDSWLKKVKNSISSDYPPSYIITRQKVGPYNASVGRPEVYNNCRIVEEPRICNEKIILVLNTTGSA